MKKILLTIVALSCAALVSCGKSGAENGQETKSEMQTKVEEFASFKLTTDMSKLTDKEKELVGIFLDIAEKFRRENEEALRLYQIFTGLLCIFIRNRCRSLPGHGQSPHYGKKKLRKRPGPVYKATGI